MARDHEVEDEEEEKRRRLSPKREREKDRASGWWFVRTLPLDSCLFSCTQLDRPMLSEREKAARSRSCEKWDVLMEKPLAEERRNEWMRTRTCAEGVAGVYHSSSRAKKKTKSEQNELQQKGVETTAKAPRGRNLLIPQRVHPLFRRIQSRR
ncbi:hypothetical protein K0M31_013762 [Melipona bicolor]|uniref:Uncharacterized protein n=1 Tax=Melipona bicolor TaxID=60889 RepID=A0AA40KG14_9HYME|nr:hypothetical protein K0M31_013762 [Melipona bicolor]